MYCVNLGEMVIFTVFVTYLVSTYTGLLCSLTVPSPCYVKAMWLCSAAECRIVVKVEDKSGDFWEPLPSPCSVTRFSPRPPRLWEGAPAFTLSLRGRVPGALASHMPEGRLPPCPGGQACGSQSQITRVHVPDPSLTSRVTLGRSPNVWSCRQ